MCRFASGLQPWHLRPRTARTQTASLGSIRICKVFRIFKDFKRPPQGFTKSLESSRISKGSHTRVELRQGNVASLEISQRSLVSGKWVASLPCRWLQPWPLRPRSARTQTASLGSSRIYKVFRIFKDLKQPPEGFTKSLKSSRISKGSQTRVELRRRKVASLEVSQRSLVTGGCVASPLGCNRGICGRGPLARRPRHLAPLEFAKSLESSRISNDLHKASPNH